MNEIGKDLLSQTKGGNVKELCSSRTSLLKDKSGRQHSRNQLIVHNAHGEMLRAVQVS